MSCGSGYVSPARIIGSRTRQMPSASIAPAGRICIGRECYPAPTRHLTSADPHGQHAGSPVNPVALLGDWMHKTFKVQIVRDGSMSAIPLTFDPKTVFGKVRVPVKVTLNGYTYRSTIAAMGGPPFIPLRRSHREAAGLEGGEVVEVRLDLDTEPREVSAPRDLLRALKATPGAMDRWQAMSYTHQREHVEAIEGAKKPETRARRIERAVQTPRRTFRSISRTRSRKRG